MRFPKKTVASIMSLSLLLGNANLLTNNVNLKIVHAKTDSNKPVLSNVSKS